MHLLGYIKDNKTLVFSYYADMKGEPLSEMLEKSDIKTENNLIALSDSGWQYCPYTDRSTGACIIFYWFGPIYHGTHVTGPVAQSITESEYNAACTTVMSLAHSRMLIREFLTSIQI